VTLLNFVNIYSYLSSNGFVTVTNNSSLRKFKSEEGNKANYDSEYEIDKLCSLSVLNKSKVNKAKNPRIGRGNLICFNFNLHSVYSVTLKITYLKLIFFKGSSTASKKEEIANKRNKSSSICSSESEEDNKGQLSSNPNFPDVKSDELILKEILESSESGKSNLKIIKKKVFHK